jgi:hypothetical protein
MGSPPSSVEGARRRLRDMVRRGEKLGVIRSDLAALPAARLLTNSGSGRCWSGVSLTLITVAVILAVTAVLARCYAHHEASTSAHTSGVTAASLDPWSQQQQLQSLVSVISLLSARFTCIY